MKLMLRRASLFAVLPAGAEASPSFKPAPGGGDKSGAEQGGGFGFDFGFDFGLAEDGSMPPALQFLGDYYGYLAVVFVVLMLFLFARGSGDEDARSEAGVASDDDFFDPEDAERFRKGR